MADVIPALREFCTRDWEQSGKQSSSEWTSLLASDYSLISVKDKRVLTIA